MRRRVSELKPDDLAETVQAISKAGARAVPVTLDVRSLSSIERAMADVLTAFGHLDVLVNNAGVPLTCPAVEITEGWRRAHADVLGIEVRRPQNERCELG